MSAPLNASATTVGSLLSSYTFTIPEYQREYAWQSTEVAEFWNDLSQARGKGPYFLGLIVLTGEGKPKQVVDGQQRLLTITLLAAALRSAAITVGRKALAEQLHSTMLRSMDYTTDKILPRVTLTDPRADQTLQSIIDHGDIDARTLATKGSSSERLWEAYQYIRKSLPSGNGKEAFRDLGTWAEFINDELYVAVFEHPDEAAAYSVFEVVNTRGRQLTTADLLKNYVLRKTPTEARESRYDQWYRMAEQFEVSGSQNFVGFIRHVVNLTAGYILPKDLYNYISRRGGFEDVAPISVDELMKQLQIQIPLYLQLIDPTLDGPADQDALGAFAALNELGVTAVRPLLLAMSSTDDATSGMLEVLKLIVKRVVVGNLGAGSVERKFADAARIVHETGSCQQGLIALQDMNHSREDFVEQLSHRSYNKGVLTFIRRSIVCSTMTPVPAGTLQHLRPRQAASQDWPGFGDDDVAYWGSTLGNTILVDLDRRPRGASTWTGVQQHLIPRAIGGEIDEKLSNLKVWTPEAVEIVGNELAMEAANVWY
ncbi:DUF262 domain-containing protein [Actinomadura darangshiensis]|uniref:DUF262 domain-containing protein n=1 Tax=Actinomadura darangshiensis TaxID=705336 RepID=UPI001407A677|nr:DUF262 domain-containing protein [Actinomadura darangshiensis]